MTHSLHLQLSKEGSPSKTPLASASGSGPTNPAAQLFDKLDRERALAKNIPRPALLNNSDFTSFKCVQPTWSIRS